MNNAEAPAVMKIIKRLIVAAGLLTMAFLLWKFDPRAVWSQVSQIGWGFALILPLQIFTHLLNATGWLMAFEPEDARDVSFLGLVKVRIAGDGVNYLTPSASIAGELIRPRMLGGAVSEHARNASVAVAVFAQALAQQLFILLGFLFVLNGRLSFLQGSRRAFGIGGAFLAILFLVAVVFALSREPAAGTRFWQKDGRIGAMRGLMRRYLAARSGRFALCILFFLASYAWCASEVLVACRFMGIAMPLSTALAVEVLSNAVDALMFMVPAKVGTQEAGKVLIFRALGYSSAQGLAFGLIRHIREILWASFGLLLYSMNHKQGKEIISPHLAERPPIRRA